MATDKRPALTETQHQVLQFIARHYGDLMCSPTVREIADHMGYTTTNGAVCHLRALLKKGYLKQDKFLTRSLAIPEMQQKIRAVSEQYVKRLPRPRAA